MCTNVRESLVTLDASEWFLASVSYLSIVCPPMMVYKIRFASKRSISLVTDIASNLHITIKCNSTQM